MIYNILPVHIVQEVPPISSLRETFSRNLQQYREQNDYTQEELSIECGYDRTYIGKIERGDKDPSLEAIIRITEALNISASVLFDERNDDDSGQSLITDEGDSDVYKKVFRKSDHMILLTNPKGVILQLNNEVVEYTGHDIEDLIGIPLLRANVWNLDEDQQEDLRSALIEAEDHSASELEFTLDSNNEDTDLLISITPVSLEDDSGDGIDFIIVESVIGFS